MVYHSSGNISQGYTVAGESESSLTPSSEHLAYTQATGPAEFT